MTGDFGGTATREKPRGEYRCDILGIAVSGAADPASCNQPAWWITIFDGVSMRLFRDLWGFVSTVTTLLHHHLTGQSRPVAASGGCSRKGPHRPPIHRSDPRFPAVSVVLQPCEAPVTILLEPPPKQSHTSFQQHSPIVPLLCHVNRYMKKLTAFLTARKP